MYSRQTTKGGNAEDENREKILQSATESKSALVENLLEYARNLHFDYSECELDSQDEQLLEDELKNYFYYELMNDGEQIVKTFINKLI